ncbi:MAG: insulinase family protein [Candidatus Krumholzibacteria bacterium]|nr:insulinase family protein [Candidatus Krumholzibacteria bacterium]
MLKLPRPHKVSFESGATLLYQRNPVSSTIAFGVWFKRGSRDESSSERGFSHLLEHMIFRGTKRRSAIQIAYDLESIGGQWDAFTSKECTSYYGKVLEEHFEKLADIFADITLNPSISESAFEIERKVVREEIRSVKDSPEESAHELFFETLFREHPLGRPVAGCLGDVAACTRSNLLTFHKKAYTSANAVFGFVGNLPLKKVVSILEDKFRFARKGIVPKVHCPEAGSGRFRSIRRADWLQSHVCIGARTAGASSRDRHALVVLSNILGGGVSSRLFQSMREKAGLAYAIYAHTNFWRDVGAFWTFFSVDPRNLPTALEIFHGEIAGLLDGKVKGDELESAKAQIKGSVVFGIESVTSRLFRLFHGEFYRKRYVSPAEAIRAIERVSGEKVIEAAKRYLGEGKLAYVTCGPVNLRGLIGRASEVRRNQE